MSHTPQEKVLERRIAGDRKPLKTKPGKRNPRKLKRGSK